MGWVYLDDRFPEHPKVLAAGDDAGWMFVCGLAYTNRHDGDGRIPKNAVSRLTGHRNPASLAQRLVGAGLWHDKDGFYVIHNYEFWNASAMARRAKARKAANTRWHSPSSAPSNAQASPEQVPKQSPSSATAMQYPKPLYPITSNPPVTQNGTGSSPQDEDQDKVPKLHEPAYSLVERWLTVIERPTPLARADAERWIPHMLTIVDHHVVDECIGRCAAESATPPKRIGYLVAAVRSHARDHDIEVPDPPSPKEPAA